MDCRTCKHNSYGHDAKIADWVSCSHPATIAKSPKWAAGDPAWVNIMTGDVPVSRIGELVDCQTWEARGA